jgi:hypothetical protein
MLKLQRPVFSCLKHRLGAINKYARSIEGFFVHVFSAIVIYPFDLMFKKGCYLLEFSALAIS